MYVQGLPGQIHVAVCPSCSGCDEDTSLGWRQNPAQHIEDGRLAGPIRTDETDQLSGGKTHAIGVDSGNSTKAAGQTFGRENDVRTHCTAFRFLVLFGHASQASRYEQTLAAGNKWRQSKDTYCVEIGTLYDLFRLTQLYTGAISGRVKSPSPRERNDMTFGLLAAHEPQPLEVANAEGGSDFVLICEHAGRRIPESLGDLGLPPHELSRHIAWDIGAREISLALAEKLDAPLFMQRYSRLVCDCNRRPDRSGLHPGCQ